LFFDSPVADLDISLAIDGDVRLKPSSVREQHNSNPKTTESFAMVVVMFALPRLDAQLPINCISRARRRLEDARSRIEEELKFEVRSYYRLKCSWTSSSFVEQQHHTWWNVDFSYIRVRAVILTVKR
jgi:hypothetical protein